MSSKMQYLGNVYIISAPSGGGKSTVIKELLKTESNCKLSISVTTRKQREGEIEGRDYYFKNVKEFNDLIADQKLLEYNKIYDNYYGTLKEEVINNINNGYDVLFDVDWEGKQSIKSYIANAVSIFILPPSLQILSERLKQRGLDDQESLMMRLECSKSEIILAKYYDYVLINDQLTDTVDTLRAILKSTKIKNMRNAYLQSLGVSI